MEPKITREEAEKATKAHGSKAAAAEALGVSEAAVRRALKRDEAPQELVDTRLLRSEAARRSAEVAAKELRKRLSDFEEQEEIYSRLKPVRVEAAMSRPKTGLRPAATCSIASDWHVGEVVTEEESLGSNHYDLAEMKLRAEAYWGNVLFLRNDAKRTTTAEDHVLILGGDMISGSIHPELSATNEVGLVDQVQAGYEAIMPGIEALSNDCRKVVVIGIGGNHGRMTLKSQIKDGWANSLDVLLYRMLREGSKHLENVEFHIPRAEAMHLDVMGHRLRVQHGTFQRSNGGTGGILVPLRRFAFVEGGADYFIFGHFHQAQWFDEIIVNGSLIGDSGYNRLLGLGSRPPEQVFFVMDQVRGVRRFERVSVT